MEKFLKWLEVVENLETYILAEPILEYLRKFDEITDPNEYVLYVEGRLEGRSLIFDREPLVPPQHLHEKAVMPFWVPHDGFWGFIHKHPYPFIRFSGPDQSYTHMYPFAVAFLWCGGHIVQAIYRDMVIAQEKVKILDMPLKNTNLPEKFEFKEKEIAFPLIWDKRVKLETKYFSIEKRNKVMWIDK
ncbi:MPN domain-containing protein [Thermodesulfatator autotrophicus]|uniref:JAB domain-containing protein n=1 Tax=Thermodesulfatator autotrophicus TaxID=1795632 RepID=A0A177E618_9BACT|nr:hypothetical protein [Thermodesulfatator autotrophicus]OAG26672.1 hypothetical protein TH606_11115 [Thermodesulfatator autotrophicus]